MSKNAINVIKPYKWNDMWVFDDQRVDLDKEPFVAGADTMIDTAIELKGIQNADHVPFAISRSTSALAQPNLSLMAAAFPRRRLMLESIIGY